MKISKIAHVALSRLRLNEGQLDWLPRNPRQWTQTDIDLMVKSIEEDPDFAEVRPVLATPGPDGTLVVFAHNLLTKASQVRGTKTLPVATFTPETEEDEATIRRLAIKDNGSLGAWDYDALANEWDDNPLADWGVPAWNVPASDGPLPEELSGLDLNPDDLPKIQGTDQTAMERIIICYRKEQEAELAALLGVTKFDKVVYDFSEFNKSE